MAQLLNNETLVIGGGTYGVKSTGSLDVQWQIGSEAFTTIPNGDFTGVAGVILDLPRCTIKVANAGVNTLFISNVSGYDI
jgi:hypothetical protein|tara:strand:+ start:68 stop:307 length:240 start_codon:yes stop_codon:yes gene_type:complete